MNLCGHLGHVHISLHAYYCMLCLVWVKVRIRFSVWLDSGYAHVFILPSVVIVTLPHHEKGSTRISTEPYSTIFACWCRLKNNHHCTHSSRAEFNPNITSGSAFIKKHWKFPIIQDNWFKSAILNQLFWMSANFLSACCISTPASIVNLFYFILCLF